MGEESNLYMAPSVLSFLAFLVSLYYCLTGGTKSEHGNYPILILGLLGLAKSIEYYEKYTYKLNSRIKFQPLII